MTLWKINFAAWVVAPLFPLTLSAAPPTTYIWSNTKGFESASNCEFKSTPHISFYIAQKPNSDLNSHSKFTGQGFLKALFPSSLLDRSLVATQGVATETPTIFVKVLSVPKNAHNSGVINIAKPRDEGLLEKESLQDLGNFVLEIVDLPVLLTTVKPPFAVNHTYWQAAMDTDQYTLLNCTDGALTLSYVVFDVYNSTNVHPVAQVGLRVDQTDILNFINVFTPDEANQAVSPGDPVEPPALAPGTMPTPASSPTPPPAADSNSNQVPVTDGKLEYVLCTEESTADVLDPDLKKVIFEAEQFEPIIPIQSWDEKQKTSHIEVQFPNRSTTPKSGWVPRGLVQLKADCKEIRNDSGTGDDDNSLDMTGVVLNTKDCCKFPTIKRSSQSYTTGTLRFRAIRARGHRLHAGCDLYRKRGEPAVAVASGVVIRGLYYFYQGVFAIEIHHPKFVARYGEILGTASPGVSKGKIVKAGQEIGRIGRVSSGCCTPMLHFELYKGTTTGSLTRYRRPPYDRRSDLMDPTPLLRKWEKSQFGVSY